MCNNIQCNVLCKCKSVYVLMFSLMTSNQIDIFTISLSVFFWMVVGQSNRNW